MKRLACMLIALVLLLSFGSFSLAEDEGITNITMYYFYPNTQTFDGWLNAYFEKTIGVHIDVVVQDNDRLQTMIAGDNLTDMGNFKLNNTIENCMLGNLLVNLDDYKDELPNIYERYPNVVEYSRKMFSCGQDGLYVMPTQIGIYNNYPIDTDTQSIKLRWDAYMAVGAPEIDSWDTLIDVLGQMMEECPTAEEGIKTWGMAFHGNNGQDTGLANIVLSVEGIMANVKNSLLYYDLKTGELGEMFADDSPWYEAMKVIFKANQAGVLDPDTLTQTYDQLRAKNRLGGTLSVLTGQYTGPYNTAAHLDNEENPSGYLEIAEDWLYPVGAAPQTYGSYGLSISAKSEHIDKCVELLNLLYDPYVNLIMYNGPQGELWDIDENGELYATDKFWNEYMVNNEAVLSDGTVFSTGSWWGPYAIAECTETGMGAGKVYRETSWLEVRQKETEYKVYDLWRSVYADEGWVCPSDAYHTWGNHLYQVTWTNFFEAMDEDTTVIFNACKQVWLEDMYKMAFAADEAEFDALFKDLQTRLAELGVEKVYAWGYEQAEAAQELEASFGS
ncbi:MAG: extracellular solute-binding protein [Clostridia bacterium]|nr:extracellular solute-binding protein [Clostridia bacterium]